MGTRCVEEWKIEIPLIEGWFTKLGDGLPEALGEELNALKHCLSRMSAHG